MQNKVKKPSPGVLGMYALDLEADPLFLKTGRPFYVCERAVHYPEKVDQYSAARCGLFPPSDFFHISVILVPG